MTETTDTVTAHRAVELVLTHRAATEPGFLERVAIDPRGVVEEIVAEVSDDDDVDLSGVDLNVHVASPRAAHFVIELPQEGEVVGFSLGGDPLGFSVRAPSVSSVAVPIPPKNTTTDTRCATNVCKSKAIGSCPRDDAAF